MRYVRHLNPVETWLGGNMTLQLQMYDLAEPGAAKNTIGITLWDSGGTLRFSSNWNSTATKEQAITGGNLQVR